MHVNIVNNFYKPGPATPTGTSKRGRIIAIDKKVSDSDKKSYPAIFDTWGDFFIQGNVVDDGQINGAADYDRCMKATKDNWEFIISLIKSMERWMKVQKKLLNVPLL